MLIQDLQCLELSQRCVLLDCDIHACTMDPLRDMVLMQCSYRHINLPSAIADHAALQNINVSGLEKCKNHVGLVAGNGLYKRHGSVTD